jgi:hypothetical protein
MSQGQVFCSSCGARNDPQAAYCSACGSRLGAPQARAESAPPPPPPAEYAPPARAEPAKKGSSLPLLLALGAVTILLVVVAIEAVIILLPRGSAPVGGAVLAVRQGEVFVQRGGQGDWVAVAKDAVVGAGDRIRTADASHAVLTFLEGTSSELWELTELTIDELELAPSTRVVIRLDLDAGEIWNRIAELPEDSLHEVTTLAASVTCRGTEYGMAVNDVGTTWIRGHDGRAEVTAGGSTTALSPGDTLMVEVGSPPVSYGSVAMLPTPPVEETSGGSAASVEGADMPTFLNQPIPTGTPTNTPPPTSTPRPVQPSPTPTATRPRPTATTQVCPSNCPTFRINVPSTGPPYRLFGVEWDVLGGSVPAGYSYVMEFSQDQSAWGRTPVLKWKDSQGQGDLWLEGGHTKAEIHGPGPGNWYWRVCIVRSETGPSCCCGPSHTIAHQRDDSC